MTKFNTSPPAALGAEAKLSRKFTEELLQSFIKSGPATIQQLLSDKPDAYLRLIAGLPSAAEPANPIQGLTDDELERAITFIRKAVGTPDRARKRARPAPADEPAEPLQALPEAEGLP
jgi:hypothetical protein